MGANRVIPALQIPRDLLAGIPEDLADVLNDRFRKLEELHASTAGLRGPVELATQKQRDESGNTFPGMDFRNNRAGGAEDPIYDQDLVNLRYLNSRLQCEKLVEILEECSDHEDLVVQDSEDPTVSTSINAPPWFVGVSLHLEPSVNDSVVDVDNAVFAFGFHLPYDFTVSTIVTRVNTAGGGSHGVGIYNSSGVLQVQTGPVTSGSVQTNRTSVTPTPLTSGYYYMAQTNGSGGGAPQLTHLSGVIGPTAGDRALLNSGTVRFHKSTDGSNGTLPGSITLTASGVSFRPLYVIFES